MDHLTIKVIFMIGFCSTGTSLWLNHHSQSSTWLSKSKNVKNLEIEFKQSEEEVVSPEHLANFKSFLMDSPENRAKRVKLPAEIDPIKNTEDYVESDEEYFDSPDQIEPETFDTFEEVDSREMEQSEAKMNGMTMNVNGSSNAENLDKLQVEPVEPDNVKYVHLSLGSEIRSEKELGEVLTQEILKEVSTIIRPIPMDADSSTVVENIMRQSDKKVIQNQSELPVKVKQRNCSNFRVRAGMINNAELANECLKDKIIPHILTDRFHTIWFPVPIPPRSAFDSLSETEIDQESTGEETQHTQYFLNRKMDIYQ